MFGKTFVFCFTFVLLVRQDLQAAQVQPFIIGGNEVDIASHPYLVSIRFRREVGSPYRHECAGSIYSESVILTAAQCFAGVNEEVKVLVVAGSNTRSGSDGQAHPVKKWITHEKYSSITVDYDIAVVILEEPLALNDYDVGKISIKEKQPASNRLATIAGWGYREEFGPSSEKLEEAKVPIVSKEDCEASYDRNSITDRMICAGFLSTGGTDACNGDTGGPLVIDNHIAGLVSWGRGCARPGYPSVYTFVGSLKQWIDDTIASNA